MLTCKPVRPVSVWSNLVPMVWRQLCYVASMSDSQTILSAIDEWVRIKVLTLDFQCMCDKKFCEAVKWQHALQVLKYCPLYTHFLFISYCSLNLSSYVFSHLTFIFLVTFVWLTHCLGCWKHRILSKLNTLARQKQVFLFLMKANEQKCSCASEKTGISWKLFSAASNFFTLDSSLSFWLAWQIEPMSSLHGFIWERWTLRVLRLDQSERRIQHHGPALSTTNW